MAEQVVRIIKSVFSVVIHFLIKQVFAEYPDQFINFDLRKRIINV